ncbi:MAG: flippase-like domain-containing protein [Dysgonamonadaceae bacterium]|jgi:uncharacterized protein (TIRG00374 family)|nr:flippase-like domain-containing protein [Dysgonamonadaceae bacterium]
MFDKLKTYVIKFLKITIPLCLGIFILYILYKETNFNELWVTIQAADWVILFLSLPFCLAANIIRALRWRLLILPLGYHPKRSSLIYAVLGNYAVNFAIPRGGEIWRCTAVSAKEKISLSKLIGTLVVDRIFDMLMVALVILLAFLLNVKAFSEYVHTINLPGISLSASFYTILCVTVAVVIFVFVRFRENKYIKKTRDFFANLWKDMLSIKKMDAKRRFLIYTFAIWILYFFYFYITFYAFDFMSHLGISAGLFVFAISSLSMGIPSNGGLGPWQAATIFGLSIFAVANDKATAFATTVFAFQSIGIVLTGLWGILMLSMYKNNKNHIKL